MFNMKVRVERLIAKYGTRNPELLAKELGITILRKPFKNNIGFFKKVSGKKFIVLNSNLDQATQDIVLARELGVAILTSNTKGDYTDKCISFTSMDFETEANKFAAELLISEKDIANEHLKDFTLDQLARYYGFPKQLIEHKFNKLKN